MKGNFKGSLVYGMTRRDVVRGVGGLALGSSMMSMPSIARAADDPEDKQIVFACPGGATQKEFEARFIPDFFKRTGIKVRYFPGQPADVLAQVRVQKNHPELDVIWVGGGFTYQAIDEQLVADIDRSLVPNMDLIAPSIQSTETAMTPAGISICGLLNNSDVFAKKGFGPPTSWLDLWDPKFKGHVGLYSINTAATNVTLVMIAKILTGDYKNVDAAFAKFSQLRSNMLDFYSSGGAWETAMQQGDLWLGVNNAGRAMQLKNAGLPVEFAKPKEGYVAYGNWLGIVKGSRNSKAAHAWVNYLLSTEVQSQIITSIGYNPVNREVKAPPELKPYFPDYDQVFLPDGRFLASQLTRFVDRWNKEVER